MSAQADVGALVRKLDSTFSLSEHEKAAVTALPLQISVIAGDQDIVRQGDQPTRSCLMLDGFACSYKISGEGRRQILAFQNPGDVPDLLSLHLRTLDSTVGILTKSTVAFIRHEDLRALCRAFPRITDAFWRITLIDGAIYREWISNIGQREAYARVAHILCETLVRLAAVSLVEDRACDFPITQQELGEATGISTVHVNRTLQALRGDGLIELQNGKLKVLDWAGLEQAGDFDPEYLHLTDAAQSKVVGELAT